MNFSVGITAIGMPLQLYTFVYKEDLKVVVHCGTFLDSVCGAEGFLQKVQFAKNAASHGLLFYKPKATLVTEFEVCTAEEVLEGGICNFYVDQVGALILFERLHGWIRQVQGLEVDEQPLSSLDIIRRQEWEIHLRTSVVTGCPIAKKHTDLDHVFPEMEELVKAQKPITLHRQYVPISILLYQTLFMHSLHAKEDREREAAAAAAAAQQKEEAEMRGRAKPKSRRARRAAGRQKLILRAKMTKDQTGHFSENEMPLIRTRSRYGRRKVDSNYWSDDDTSTFRGCYFGEE